MHGNIFEWCRDCAREKLPGGSDTNLCDGWPCRSVPRLRFEPERRYDTSTFASSPCGRYLFRTPSQFDYVNPNRAVAFRS